MKNCEEWLVPAVGAGTKTLIWCEAVIPAVETLNL
jgi:hypothetical protein